MAITIDESGNIVDFLKEKNDAIKKSLQFRMAELLEEKRADVKRKSKFGFRAMMQIEDELMQYPLMSAEKFCSLDYDDIEYFWRSFHNLMSHYNMMFEIVPTRQTFMLYLGINSRMYKKLVNGGDQGDDDIKELMTFIEDRLVGKAFTAGESGEADVKAVSQRLRAKEVGHDVISASEEKMLESLDQKTPSDLNKWLATVIGSSDEPKRLK